MSSPKLPKFRPDRKRRDHEVNKPPATMMVRNSNPDWSHDVLPDVLPPSTTLAWAPKGGVLPTFGTGASLNGKTLECNTSYCRQSHIRCLLLCSTCSFAIDIRRG